MQVYSVYDMKAGSYTPPFLARTPGEAVRIIANTVRSVESILAQYPADFQLVLVGEWDEMTGVLSPCPLEVVGVVATICEELAGYRNSPTVAARAAVVDDAPASEDQ